YQDAWVHCMRGKLGLLTQDSSDFELAEAFLAAMAVDKLDFTNTFHGLAARVVPGENGSTKPDHDAVSDEMTAWLAKWRTRLAQDQQTTSAQQEQMRSSNPAIIPRNHRVEEMITAAMAGNFQPFEALLEVVTNPYDASPAGRDYTEPPRPDQVVHATFCGT
ncbi:MAG: protein adenylyltransferase SelO family protein, partial [Pseudomonadota bacterium]